jgi:hypothetical protein
MAEVNAHHGGARRHRAETGAELLACEDYHHALLREPPGRATARSSSRRRSRSSARPSRSGSSVGRWMSVSRVRPRAGRGRACSTRLTARTRQAHQLAGLVEADQVRTPTGRSRCRRCRTRGP